MSMPTKNSVPGLKAWGRVMPKDLAIDGALKPMDSTCMASASQTRSKITNRRYWNLPTPAVCRPCSIEMREAGEEDVMGWRGGVGMRCAGQRAQGPIIADHAGHARKWGGHKSGGVNPGA